MAGLFGPITDMIAAGKELGVFDFYFPFIVIFAILWALLTKVKIFGDPFGKDKKQAKLAKGVNLVISVIGSLFVLAYTPVAEFFSVFLAGLFAGGMMVILSIVGVAIIAVVILGVASGGTEELKNHKKTVGLVVLLGIILGIAAYISSGGAVVFPGLALPGITLPEVPTIAIPAIGLTTQDAAVIFLIVATIAVILYLIWPEKEKKD